MKKGYMIVDSCWTFYALIREGVFTNKNDALKRAEELAIKRAMEWTHRNNELWKEEAEVKRKGDEFWIYHKGNSNLFGVVEVDLHE